MADSEHHEMFNLTEYVKNMAYRTLDLDEAVRYLNEDFPIRRIDEVLLNAIKQKAMQCNSTEEDVKAALRKNLESKSWSSWLKPGMKKSMDRESAFKIAFALHMTYEETEEFLKRCWLDGFYMRDIRDVVYRHGLEYNWDYNRAIQIINDFADYDVGNPEPEGKIHRELTEDIKNQASLITTESELRYLIQKNKQFFGSFRRKTYKRFKELYDQIKQEWDNIADLDLELDLIDGGVQDYARDTVSMKELCDVIVKGIPEMKKRGSNTIISRCITEHVPTRTAMSEIINMYERKGEIKQVDRKLLMLAWLASEDGDILNFQSGNVEEDFAEHIMVLNTALLSRHGMAPLDARHPFDWIVMNSMRCAYALSEKSGKTADIEERMRNLIEKM